jgi:hypothetical protein
MFRRLHLPANTRRGVILLVVLALLTLFAIVGISFVLYASRQADSSRYNRESEAPPQPDMDPELLLSYFLNQLIFDVDDVNGVYSGLRGHSLARNMYGYNNVIQNGGKQIQVLDNTLPFSGVGRLHTGQAFGADEFYKINYTYFKGDQFVRDPERLPMPKKTWRTDPQQPNSNLNYCPFNVDYTYPDLNNFFLAAMKASGFSHQDIPTPVPPGALLAISFHRDYYKDSQGNQIGFGNLWNDPSSTPNPNWTNATGRYYTLRPRPADNDPSFPYPDDGGGDVKNLIGSPGYFYKDVLTGKYRLANNDSIWIDLGAPVMIAPDGTKFKPLFAPLILDLDGRINLNVHGNIRGRDAQGNGQQASDEGWGPWEVNLRSVLGATGQATTKPEWPQLFNGIGVPYPLGRYGQDSVPHSIYPNNTAPPGTAPHFYAPVDFDGCNEMNNFQPTPALNMLNRGYTIPQNTNMWYYTTLPLYPYDPTTGDQSKQGYGNGTPAERKDHPLLYNFFNPQTAGQPQHQDYVLGISNMEALLRYSDTGSPALTSDLFRLLPANLQNPTTRNLVTTHSFGYDRPAVVPWVWDPNDPNYSLLLTETTGTIPVPKPKNPAIPFPGLAQRAQQPPAGSEFRVQDWRAMSAALGRVDLNRYLTPYPTINPQNPQPFDLTKPAILDQFNRANKDRTDMAKDIYMRFVVATGAYNPWNHGPTAPTGDQLKALRWLAQLSVNIVDYIDSDDIMTGFNWGQYGDAAFVSAVPNVKDTDGTTVVPNTWVFGTELPRVVINEAYMEYTQTNYQQNNPPPREFDVDVWVELYNPLQPDTADPLNGNVFLAFNGQQATLGNGPYRFVIAKYLENPVNVYASKIRKAYNVLGDPDGTFMTMNGQPCMVTDFSDPTNSGGNVILAPTVPNPVAGQYADTAAGRKLLNQPFYVLGPNKPFPHDPNQKPNPVPPVATHTSPFMTYHVKNTAQNKDETPDAHPPVLMLRRLANPYIPFNPTSNPYVTVDYQEMVKGPGTGYAPMTGQQRWAVNAATDTMGQPTPYDTRHSFGRLQPCAAFSTAAGGILNVPYWAQEFPTGTPQKYLKTGQPQHSFFRHNALDQSPTMTPPAGGTQFQAQGFDVLVHLDRQVVSPMELLQVSAFKPHELLQQFVTTTARYSHRAPWFDQTTRLYRVFEFLETGSRAAGVPVGGRTPGLININTIYDESILEALLDAQTSNNFTGQYTTPPGKSNDVATAFGQLMFLRTAGNWQSATAPFAPSWNDRPFRSEATGYSTMGDTQHPTSQIGINDTPLRAAMINSDPAPDGGKTNPRVFQQLTGFGASIADEDKQGTVHPYLKYQMVTKLFNNVTTRSNVFAVWVTVGFFKVTDDTTAPPKLGAEIGKAEGRNIRHRMFAIVDRSNLSTQAPYSPNNQNYQSGPGTPGGPPILLKGSFYVKDPSAPVPQGGYPVAVEGAVYKNGGLEGSYEGIPYRIQRGTQLLIDYPTVSGSSDPVPQEIVTVTQVPLTLPGSTPMFMAGFASRHSSSFVINVPYYTIDPNNPNNNPPPPNNFPGNPGPQSRFNARDYPWIVRHFSILN